MSYGRSDPNYELVSTQLDSIIASIMNQASKTFEKVKNQKTDSEMSNYDDIKSDSLRKCSSTRKSSDESTVVSVHCVSSLTSDQGPLFIKSKKCSAFPRGIKNAVVKSEFEDCCGGTLPLKVEVSKTADPDWIRVRTSVFNADKKCVLLIETDCRGMETRNVCINGKEAIPADDDY